MLGTALVACITDVGTPSGAPADAPITSRAAGTPGTDPDPDPVDEGERLRAALTDHRGCGYGFHLGSIEQDLRLDLWLSIGWAAGVGGAFERQVELPHPDWRSELRRGRNLFADWCDDVAGPVRPVIEEVWAVTGGTLTVQDGELPECGYPPDGKATATLERLEVTPPGREPILIGDFELLNGGWGCIPG